MGVGAWENRGAGQESEKGRTEDEREKAGADSSKNSGKSEK